MTWSQWSGAWTTIQLTMFGAVDTEASRVTEFISNTATWSPVCHGLDVMMVEWLVGMYGHVTSYYPRRHPQSALHPSQHSLH